jgi:aldose 1-epimerase
LISAPVPFGTTQSGQHVDAYTLQSKSIRMRVLTLGGIITHLEVPDRSGTLGDIVLGFDDLAPYETVSPYFGCLVGRVGNRIAKGKFTLDGKPYTLATNNNANHLHGGKVGYDKRIWKATPGGSPASPSLELALVDPDGAEGYPGAVTAKVTYTLTDTVLRIEYEATTDAPTPINLTNHTYFNLKDAGATKHFEHELTLDCGRYTPVDAELIPTGEVASVKGTPLDFTSPKPIGKDLLKIDADPRGYDHNLILKERGQEPFSGAPAVEKVPDPFRRDPFRRGLARCARVVEKTTGRVMECWTTEPAVQFYSGNFLTGAFAGKHGTVYQQYAGFCLETQHYPDSVNQPNFPNTILRPGQVYRSTTEYRFGTSGE